MSPPPTLQTPGDIDEKIAASLRNGVHWQSVRRLPAGAVLLASSAHEAHPAFRIGTSAWGVQFQPGFSAEALRAYLDGLATLLANEGQDATTPASPGRAQREGGGPSEARTQWFWLRGLLV